MKGPEGTHAWTVTVGAKGQIVIPKEARTLFSIQRGIRCSFWPMKSGGSPSRKRDRLRRCFSRFSGKIPRWSHE